MLHIVHTFLLFFISQVYVIMHAPMAVSFNLFFYLFSVWLAWLKFVILYIWNQQGNSDYRTALKIMKHFCCVEKSFFILVKGQTCFLSWLWITTHFFSYLHIPALYFLYSSCGWGNVLLLCFSMYLNQIHSLLPLN